MSEPPAKPASNGPSPRRRLKDRLPSRRDCLEVGGLAAFAGVISSLSPQTHPQAHPADLSPYTPRLNSFRDRLSEKARGWILNGVETIARPHESADQRFVYTVDLAQLMEHFAVVGDLEPYLKLRAYAVEHVIVDRKDDPFTRGFVLWRRHVSSEPDASGTTEALRVARALWAGAKAFNRPQDRALALTVLDGYARHYTVDQNIWLIRNYFSFGTRAFANNTFVVDYDADFVRQVADELKSDDPKLQQSISTLADNSYGLMRRTPTPCGLLYDLVQPEVLTMYWGLDVAAFSPNDIVQANNSCVTAATIARGEPAIAKKVLAFITGKLDSDGKVYQHYYGRTGERVTKRGTGASETMAMAKLAALVGDKAAAARLVQIGLPLWENLVSTASPEHAWACSELLLGLKEVLAAG